MSPSPLVTYTTPDGVSRLVRLTFGARKRIADKFGMPLPEVLKRYDAAAFPDILYCCMCDDAKGGKPPKDLAPNWADALDVDSAMETEMAATFMQMLAKGGLEKNVLKAMIEDQMMAEMRAKYGLIFGASPISALGSLPGDSGPAPTESSTPSSGDSGSASESETTAQDSHPPQSTT
jgi:hypothetical protein